MIDAHDGTLINGKNNMSADLNENGKRALIIMSEEVDLLEVERMRDVLRKGGVGVVTASLDDSDSVRSSSNVLYHIDKKLSDALKEPAFDILVLPGGLMGAKLLGESEVVGALLKEYEENYRWIVAIGESPSVLRKHFIGAGKMLTCHPLIKHKIEGSEYMKYKYIDDDVFVDGKIITCKGGTHITQCALNLLHLVCGRSVAENVAGKLSIEYDDGYCRDCCSNCKYCCREDMKEIEPDIADRFACSTCCSADDPDVVEWEEDKIIDDMLQREYMIECKLRREELKDKAKDKLIEKEELERQIEEDREEAENWQQKWGKGGCISEAEYEQYMREYADRDESRHNSRMERRYDRLNRRIERSNRRRDMVDELRVATPAEIDAAFALINLD